MRRKSLNKKSRFLRGTYFDYTTLFLTLFLTGFGLVMLYSASSFEARRDYGDDAYYFRKQLIIAVGGIIIMLGISFYRYQRLKMFSILLMLLAAVMLILVLFIGVDNNGSHRWLGVGPITFQPSEAAKLILIIYMAHVCTTRSGFLHTFVGTIRVAWPVIVIVGLVAVSNLSTAIICALIVVGIWFVATPKPLYIVPVLVVGVLGVLFFVNNQSYRGDRITAWKDPESSYQTMQALYSIGSGGLFGRGLGQSIQKKGFIPESYSDMIFSVICEELGIVGAAGILLIFVFLIWRLRLIAEGAPDRFGSLIVCGVIIHLAVQVIVNVSVVTNVIPNTGVTLPFISYGGTSILLLFAEMGLVLAISRQIVPRGREEVAV